MVWRICTDNLHYEKFADGTVKCIEDEIPFEVPKGWEWCRLSNIVQFINGDRGKNYPSKSDYLPNGIPWINTGHILDEGILTEKEMLFISQEKYDSLHSGKIAENDLVLCLRGATFGKVARVKPYKIGAIASSLVIIRCYEYSLAEYLYYYLRSDLAIQQLHLYDNGSAQPNLAAGDVQKYLFPLPPIKEALMISERISILLALVSKISQEKRNLNAIIANIKTKILDLAIRGQLVPQNPDDEPASVLLERIRIEKEELIKQGKIKRDKKESITFKGEDNSYYEKFSDAKSRCIDNEIPFNLPDGWEYERLGNICTIARGGSPRPIENYLTSDDNGLNWIKIGDTEQGNKYIYSTKVKIRPEGLNKTRYVESGDFLLTNSMSFGRPYILRTDGCIHDGWLVIGNTETVFEQDYLYYLLSSTAMYNSLSSLAVGSTIKNLKSDSVRSLLVPIPPFKEQGIIATKVETLFNTILPIEKSLN